MDIYNIPTFDHTLSTFQNACLHLGNTPAHLYFKKVVNLSFHDLTLDKSVPPLAAQLLGLGMKFIVNPQTLSTFDNVDIERFTRDTWLAS